MFKDKLLLLLISLISVIFLIVIGMHDPIAQDSNYHQFSDTRTLFGIANCLNTISNIPFILVGIFGLADLKKLPSERYLPSFKQAYRLLFIGALLVGSGSGYYHLHPDNATLIWDRLPMTLAFMALFTIILAEFISEKTGQRLFWPLVGMGVISVVYWAITESQMVGDLRPYIIVQFLPMILIPLILSMRQSVFNFIQGYWLLLLCYLLAKVAEHFDFQIHHVLGFVSGHSLKHLIAAIGLFILAYSYRIRRREGVRVNQI